MSLVIEVPETLPAAVHPTYDDVPAVVTPMPSVPPQRKSSPSWWRSIVNRFSKRHAPARLPCRSPESAIDYLAREHAFVFIRAISG